MSTTVKHYENDPKTIYLKTNVDLSAATVVKGLYYLPGSTTGVYLTGAVNDHDGDGTNKWIVLTVPHSTLTPSGVSRWHSYAEWAEHSSGYGVHGSVEELIIYALGD